MNDLQRNYDEDNNDSYDARKAPQMSSRRKE
jgi:hypothetical protein